MLAPMVMLLLCLPAVLVLIAGAGGLAGLGPGAPLASRHALTDQAHGRPRPHR